MISPNLARTTLAQAAKDGDALSSLAPVEAVATEPVARVYTARNHLLSLTDSSNWAEMKGDYYRGYSDAMEIVGEAVLDCWDELNFEAGKPVHPTGDSGALREALAERDLYDAEAFMADDGEHQMTAAENVLAWLLVEKCGVVDDVSYSPKKAQTILAWWLDRCNELENAKAAEIKEPTPSYWIVTWPGKDQGVHAAYKNLEEAEHAAKNIANYSTRKTETTIIPLYAALAKGEPGK